MTWHIVHEIELLAVGKFTTKNTTVWENPKQTN